MVIGKKNIHFVGIGGIGMSGIALILADDGYNVSGSDLERNALTEKIVAKGGHIYKGHKASHVAKDVEVVIYSSSIAKDNPEIVEAKRRGLPIVHRAKALAEVFARKKTIAVTGTHGKTTTTSLVAVMCERCGLDPTVAIGGEVEIFGANAKRGKGAYAVIEADESDGSFLHLKPFFSVITNIEPEHIDYYRSFDDALSAYRGFVENTKARGKVFYNRDDKNLSTCMKGFRGATETFGITSAADMCAVDIVMKGSETEYVCIYKRKILGKVALRIPGRHNVMNSLAAVLVGINLGLDFKMIAEALSHFRGAKRRFDLRCDTNGVMLIEDYAHHPTEIRAVLRACRNWRGRRVVAVFQPHRYTRTLYLADAFGKCFTDADKLILTDIYAASEEPIKDVSVRMLYDRIKEHGPKDVVILQKDAIPDHIMKLKRRGDMIVVMGAGDIKKTADILSQRMTGPDLRGELARLMKGDVKVDEPLARHTSFRIGGPAWVWVEPRDLDDLRKAVNFAREKKMPFCVLGGGTNLLARDEAYRGIVVHLGAEYFKGCIVKKNAIRVGAGYNVGKLVRLACERGLTGLESLIGIPGSVGGALFMNAGGAANPVFKNIGDFVVSLKVMDLRGKERTLRKKEITFGYRQSDLDKYIILEATLRLDKEEPRALNARSAQFLKMKRQKQALDVPSAGCVFKNPDDFQFTCGQMIDMLGLKGIRSGGAEVSTKHANFIVNANNASCQDVLNLIELIKERVRESYHVALELEIKVL